MKDLARNIFANSSMIGYLRTKINWNIVMVSTVVLNMKILIESLAHTVLYYNITIKTLVDRGKIIVYIIIVFLIFLLLCIIKIMNNYSAIP